MAGSSQAAGPIDPAIVLGVGPDASEDDIRAAYLAKVKEHPPERDPERFEAIRDAYEMLRDPRRRLRHRLLSADPMAPFTSLVSGRASPRRFVGPGPWLDVLAKR